MSKEYYDKLKEKGLCVRCCNKQAENGHVMCEKCLEITRKLSKENYEWFAGHRICPRCGKNRLFGNEKQCPECRAKGIIITKRSRIKTHGSIKQYYRDKRAKYIAEGRCVRCGKPVVEDLKYCQCCLDREKERHKKDRLMGKHTPEIPRYERFFYGLCYICGKPLDTDKRLCSECCEKLGKNFHGKRGDGNAWKMDNKRVFGGVANG